MNESNSPLARRQAALMRAVIENGGMDVEALAELLDVSAVTIYRDVARLVDEGIVKLERGSVQSTAASIFDMSSAMRAGLEQEEKQSFAEAVRRIVGRGSTIVVDDSSTVLPSLDALKENPPLTVVTNSLTVVERMGKGNSVEVHCVGGRFSPWSNSFYGANTINAIAGFQADYCLISDTAIQDGWMCNPYDYVAETKRAIMRAGRTKLLLADHTKFSRNALIKTAPLSDFDYLITDRDPGEDIRQQCAEGGVELVITCE